MKKIYSKPQIVFDSFELSQSIAAGCVYISNHAQNVCKVTINEPGWADIAVFADSSCTTTPPSGNDRICYDVPTDDTRVFSS